MSLFGGSTAGGGLFGGSTTGQQSTTGGSLFGGTLGQPQQNTQQSGGLFGGGASTFGQNKPPALNTSLFGGGAQQTGQTQGTGLFGNTQQNQGTGTGLFGQGAQQQQQPQQQQQGGGLFGGSMFGGQQQNQQQPQQQQQQTGGIGGSLFGQPQQQQQQQQQNTTGGLFGQSVQQPQQQQQTGGLFGNPAQNSNSLFSKPQPASLFSGSLAQQSQPLSHSQFQKPGWGTQSQAPGASVNQGPNTVVSDIEKIKAKWDRNDPNCEFKYYFYNQIDPAMASSYPKPPNEDQKAWDKAWSARPGPGAVPVEAYGFEDLNTRMQAQTMQIATYRTVLHHIDAALKSIQQRHELVNSLKLEHCRRRHIELARRALSLAAKVQVLKNRGYALQPEEEVLKKRLEQLHKEVSDPGVWGRLNEIWARMTVVRERARKMEEEVGSVSVEWDEQQLKTTQKLLMNNSKGLQLLANEVKEIEKAFTEWEAAFNKA